MDWGSVRIGVAACDSDGTLAYPLTTVLAGPEELSALSRLVAEHRPIEVVVGLPRTLAGREESAAAGVREKAEALARLLASTKTPVRLVDERLSTVSAARQLHSAGKSARKQRSMIDSAAAAAILQSTLDGERLGGSPPGRLISPAS